MRFLLSAIDFSDISTNIGNICVIELLGTFQNEISCLFRKTRHFFGIDSEKLAIAPIACCRSAKKKDGGDVPSLRFINC